MVNCILGDCMDFMDDVPDKYYDLAKLNHSFILNHGILSQKNGFSIDIKDNAVNIDVLLSAKSIKLKKYFDEFLVKNGYNVRLVNILTAIIWSNMSVLHIYPLNFFLYYWSKYCLYLELKNKI